MPPASSSRERSLAWPPSRPPSSASRSAPRPCPPCSKRRAGPPRNPTPTSRGPARSATTRPASEAKGLLLLGDERGPDGRHLSASELLAGADVLATLQTLSVQGAAQDVTTASLSRTLRDACGVADGRLLASLDPQLWDTNDAADPSFGMRVYADVYKFTLQGSPCVWWSTLVRSAYGDQANIRASFGASRLDYYARSRLVEATYDAVAAMAGPWDVNASREFPAMSTAERLRLGLL